MWTVAENSHRRIPGRYLGNQDGCAAPAGGFVTPHSGGPGTRPGGITTAPQGACWTGTGASLVPGSTDPGTEIAAMERRGARASQDAPALRKARTNDWAPSGAPSPSHCGGGPKGVITAYPAPQRTGAMARALFIPPLKGEGGSERSEEPGGVALRWRTALPTRLAAKCGSPPSPQAGRDRLHRASHPPSITGNPHHDVQFEGVIGHAGIQNSADGRVLWIAARLQIAVRRPLHPSRLPAGGSRPDQRRRLQGQTAGARPQGAGAARIAQAAGQGDRGRRGRRQPERLRSHRPLHAGAAISLARRARIARRRRQIARALHVDHEHAAAALHQAHSRPRL